MNVFDTRRLGIPVHSIADPYLQDGVELSVTGDGDMMVFGDNGFTLWKSNRSGFTFRGFQETSGGKTRGAFVDLKRGFTTDSDGTFQEWDFKRHVSAREKSVAVPPYEKEGGRVPGSYLHRGPASSHRHCSAMVGPNRSCNDSANSGINNNHTPTAAVSGKPSSATPTAAGGEWDWDLDFSFDRKTKGEGGAEEAPSPSAASSSADKGKSQPDTMASLPLKDLDELIGFYLS